ncbi:glycosyltransferase [Psychroserpens mesophilus]|uniref:glycosyltransferase n=1 Tax=Psychroserpens mesophilus TaxID=325473 RepID=UPI003D64D694
MQKPITIVHITGSLGGGGLEQMVFQFAKRSNSSIKTIVVSVTELNTLEDKFLKEGIEVHFLNISSFRNSTLTKGLNKLHNIIKDHENVVFHCHQFHSGLLAVMYRIKYKNIPITYTMHTNKVASVSRRWILFLAKPFRKKDIIFSVNSKKWYLKNSVVIPNGVDFLNFNPEKERIPSPSKPFVFLFLGRLSTPKNPLALITIANQLKNKNITNFVIHVAGDGIMKQQLIDAIAKNNLETHFKLLGFVNDIKTVIDVAHCLILPSLWEGMPVAIIEAAASKLPIISTPVGSIPDFLNKSNATVCDVNLFPKQMISMIENYDEAIKKARTLYEEAKSVFNIDSVYLKHLEIYQSTLK